MGRATVIGCKFYAYELFGLTLIIYVIITFLESPISYTEFKIVMQILLLPVLYN